MTIKAIVTSPFLSKKKWKYNHQGEYQSEMNYCPECKKCWDHKAIYDFGTIPSYGKSKIICGECKKKANG